MLRALLFSSCIFALACRDVSREPPASLDTPPAPVSTRPAWTATTPYTYPSAKAAYEATSETLPYAEQQRLLTARLGAPSTVSGDRQVWYALQTRDDMGPVCFEIVVGPNRRHFISTMLPFCARQS